MPINSDNLTGFFVGLGVASLGFYLYKRNESQIGGFMQAMGLNWGATRDGHHYAGKSLEELVEEKEHLEDLIAELEMRHQKKEPESEQKLES